MCNITSLAQPLFGVIVPSPNPGQNVGKILQQQEELAQRGQELYESCIRSQIEVGNDGKIVAIDIRRRSKTWGASMAALQRYFEVSKERVDAIGPAVRFMV